MVELELKWREEGWLEGSRFLGGQPLINLPRDLHTLSVLPTPGTIGEKNISYFMWEGKCPFHTIPEPHVPVKAVIPVGRQGFLA